MSSSSSVQAISKSIDVLIVEDDVGTASALARILDKNGYVAAYSLNLTDALTAVDQNCPKLVLLDLSLPDGSGLNGLAEFKRRGVQEVIVVSGTDSPEYTRQCLTAGAYDFISKPANAAEVLASVRRADMLVRLEQLSRGSYPFLLTPGFGSLEGASESSKYMFRNLKAMATNFTSGGCLITGPAGVMKNDIAASVEHYRSGKSAAFLINCAGEDDDYALERFNGKFNEAGSALASEGYMQRAGNGSIVLDDVSALRMDVQIMLAEFLESGRITPSNADKPQECACAVIAVLREEAKDALEQGRLHTNLYDALAINTIDVPGLQERSDDIGFFASKAVQQLNSVFDTEKSVSEEFLKELYAYDWPGNLVEFRNLILMAYRLTEPGEELSSAGLLLSREEPAVNKWITPFIGMSLRDAERQLVEATLIEHDNNKRKVAEVLGVSVKTLYNRLKSYEQDVIV